MAARPGRARCVALGARASGAGRAPRRARAARGAPRRCCARTTASRAAAAAVSTVNDAAAALAVALDDDGRVRISAGDALGSIVAVAVTAMLDGTWPRLKVCRNCGWSFYDYSKNRSASWCSMQICGNRPEDARVSQAEGRAMSRPACGGAARAPLQVAAARLRAHPGAGLLVLLGVAASIAMLVSVLGGSVIARDREVQKAVAALPESQRSFEVDAFGLPAGPELPRGRPHGAPAQLATLDSGGAAARRRSSGGFASAAGSCSSRGSTTSPALVQLRSGRLPRTCVPARCEVLQLGPGGRATWNEGADPPRPGRHGDVPGQGSLRRLADDAPAGGDVARATVCSRPARGAFDRLPAFAAFYRVYSWVAPARAAAACTSGRSPGCSRASLAPRRCSAGTAICTR